MLATPVVLILVAAIQPGGCGSGLTPAYERVDMSCPGPGCDTSENPAAGPSTCSNSYGCDCSYGGNYFAAYCSSTPGSECRYCPEGYHAGSDSCDGQCYPPETTYSSCPSDYPYECSDGSCCPSDYPICCGSGWCGKTSGACANVDDSTDGGGGSGCGQFSGGCAAIGGYSASLREGCCLDSGCGVSSCSDDCGYGWYEVGGSLYGPCSSGDSTCLNSAASAAIAAGGC